MTVEPVATFLEGSIHHHAPMNVATFNQTVYVDGRKIYEDGKLTVLEEAEIEKLAKTFGAPATLLEQNRIDLS